MRRSQCFCTSRRPPLSFPSWEVSVAQRLLVLRLRPGLLRRADRLRHAVRAQVSSADYVHAWSALALASVEHAFALGLLGRRTSLWLYRTHQRAFAGDFIVVDMSASVSAQRRVFALELKSGEHVREGRGGVQLGHVGAVIGVLASYGVAPS